MIKLIAFDMDGTVLDDNKKILPETKKALEDAAKSGIEIVPATGRPFHGLAGEVHKIRGVRYVVTTNGAGVYEKETGRCLHEESMELLEFIPLMERLEKMDVMADAFVLGRAYMNEDKVSFIDRMQIPEVVKEYIHTSRIVVSSQSAYLKENNLNVEKLTINFWNHADGTRHAYEETWEILQEYPQFNAVSGGMNNIEVTKKDVSKASGLRWLGEHLSVSMEEMLVFGDSGNDYAMIKAAGIGVAMANAEPEILSVADYVTKSNNDNGILFALDKFLKIEKNTEEMLNENHVK